MCKHICLVLGNHVKHIHTIEKNGFLHAMTHCVTLVYVGLSHTNTFD